MSNTGIPKKEINELNKVDYITFNST